MPETRLGMLFRNSAPNILSAGVPFMSNQMKLVNDKSVDTLVLPINDSSTNAFLGSENCAD